MNEREQIDAHRGTAHERTHDPVNRSLDGGHDRSGDTAAATKIQIGGVDARWAPFQTLCLILGPVLLETVMQPNLGRPMFDPAGPRRFEIC